MVAWPEASPGGCLLTPALMGGLGRRLRRILRLSPGHRLPRDLRQLRLEGGLVFVGAYGAGSFDEAVTLVTCISLFWQRAAPPLSRRDR